MSNHRTSGSTKRTGSGVTPPLSESESIQPRPVGLAGISSKHGTDAQSPPSSSPAQHQPAVTAEVLSNHIITQSPPPSLASTQHQPALTAGVLSDHKISQPPPPSSASTQPLPVTSNHGPAQPSWQPQLPVSPPPDQTTPAPVPLTKPIPPSQHHQAPPNVVQERQPQAQACAFAKETLNISLKVGMASPFTPNVTAAITSYKSRDGGSESVPSHADPLGSKLKGPTGKAPKPDVAPPQTPPQKPAKRPAWQAWFQTIWTSGK
jgi:hypothetical protein